VRGATRRILERDDDRGLESEPLVLESERPADLSRFTNFNSRIAHGRYSCACLCAVEVASLAVLVSRCTAVHGRTTELDCACRNGSGVTSFRRV